jgi:hypothetical protein
MKARKKGEYRWEDNLRSEGFVVTISGFMGWAGSGGL